MSPNTVDSNQIDFKALFNSMPVPQFVMVFSKEENDFRVSVANQAVTTYLGTSEGDIHGASLEIFVPSDDLEYIKKIIHSCYQENKPAKLQVPMVSPDGFRLSGLWCIPVHNNNENKVEALHFIGVPESSSAANLQQERDDAISLLTSVFDVSEVGIVVTDHKSRIIRVNESFIRIYGWDKDQLIGHEFIEFVAPEEQPKMKKNQEEFLKNGVRSSGELKLQRKDGTQANALFTTAALELSQGRQFQVTTIMDITLRKQMETSLRHAKERADAANHAKSSFLANMSHELRTPLNAIIGFSEMIIKETFGPLGSEKYKEYLQDIHLSAEHLLEIINEVLDMSKIEAGRVELDEEYFDVTQLIQSVVRMMDSRAFSSGLKIEEKVAKNLPPLYGDPRLVRQILINLVGNAVKYSQTNGTIYVEGFTDEKEESLYLVVRDEGVGIPKNRIQYALEPFGQVNANVESQNTQGTGLGLPIAKAMTELHQGALTLESDIGEGTTVTVIFPKERIGQKGQGDSEKNNSPLSKFNKGE